MAEGGRKLHKNFYIIIGTVVFILGNGLYSSAQSQQRKNVEIYIDGQKFSSLDEYKKYRNETQEDDDNETDLPENSFLNQEFLQRKEILQKKTAKDMEKKEDTHLLKEEKHESIFSQSQISDRSNKKSSKLQVQFLPVGPLVPLLYCFSIDKVGKITKQDAGLCSGVKSRDFSFHSKNEK